MFENIKQDFIKIKEQTYQVSTIKNKKPAIGYEPWYETVVFKKEQHKRTAIHEYVCKTENDAQRWHDALVEDMKRIGLRALDGACAGCICTQCNIEFGTDSMRCKLSDCQWCINDLKPYIVSTCRGYLEKGGTYGRDAK